MARFARPNGKLAHKLTSRSWKVFKFLHLKFLKNHISTNEFRELRIVFQMFFGRFEKLMPGPVIKGITIPVLEICFFYLFVG